MSFTKLGQILFSLLPVEAASFSPLQISQLWGKALCAEYLVAALLAPVSILSACHPFSLKALDAPLGLGAWWTVSAFPGKHAFVSDSAFFSLGNTFFHQMLQRNPS